MLNDPLANALSKILNAEKVGKKEVTVYPSSKVIEKVLRIIQDKQFIGETERTETRQGVILNLNLINKINNCGVVKPRYPVQSDGFEKFEKRYLPAKGFGFLIVSTSSGLMTQEEAIEKNLGGKLIAFVY
ncbi:MAG: 30S ribosomal protein S8 [Nanoarchaeota archaeon]|nr:30S ribosomal protein S8 [Nanoarchaeota archaeon]